MKIENLYIASKMDELPLSVILAEPDGDPVGVVQLVHGMAEHKERYLPFIEYLCEYGFVCLIHDHRGHGKSVLTEDDLGYFGENGAEATVEDVHQMTEFLKERYPGKPITLFGHSMGSLTVRCYLRKYDADIDSLIVSGCVSENPVAKIGLGLVKTLKGLKGEHGKSGLIDSMALGGYSKAFKDEPSPNAWICSDPAVVEAYDADPLCGFHFTLNGYAALMGQLIDCYKTDGWAMANKNLPIHFISGEYDPCMVNLEAFVAALQFLRERGYTDVTSTLFENMRHEVLNEKEHMKVYEDVLPHIARKKLA